MRILHVVEPFSSGIITFIILLTRALPEHEHTVLHGVRTTEDKIKSVRARFPNEVFFGVWKHADRSANIYKDILALVSLIRLVRSVDYDIIHLHSAKAGFLGRIACWLLRKKNVIYTPNGAPFLRQDVSRINRSAFKILEKVASRLCGEVVCCGSSEAHVYEEEGMENIFINNAVSITDNISKPVKYPIKVGTMAILTYQKDPATFNKIASHFKYDDRVQFVWVGNGALRTCMDEEAVYITGWVEEKEANAYMKDFDIYLSTALWEGQPFAVLESMNESKCLVLRKCPGNNELVYNEENGFLFEDVKEAIEQLEKLIDNLDMITSMGKVSREMCIEDHNLEKMGEAYEAVYKRIHSKQ